MKKKLITPASRMEVEGIKGYFIRTVTKFWSSAKINCSKEYLGIDVVLLHQRFCHGHYLWEICKHHAEPPGFYEIVQRLVDSGSVFCDEPVSQEEIIKKFPQLLEAVLYVVY